MIKKTETKAAYSCISVSCIAYVCEEKYIIIYIFYFRLGVACSHVATNKLQACTLLELNKVASTSKLCAWNKSRKQVETAPLVNISFNRSKGDELVPNNIDELGPFCTVDPVRNLAKLRQKLLELKQIAPNAAVLTSTSLESDDTYVSDTDSTDEVDSNCIPEPLGSLFEPRTIDFDRQKLISYSKEVYEEYERSYTIITIYAIKQRNRVYQMPGKFTELVE